MLYKAAEFSSEFFGKTIDSVKSLVTSYEARTIMTFLADEFITSNGRLPKDIKKWLRKNFQAPAGRDKTRDPYGNPYVIRRVGMGFEVRSAGADGKLFTADDIVARYE